MTAAKEWFEEDFYEILGVPQDATDKEITKAYRSLAKQYHPDANLNDSQAEEKFKSVTHAYEVLGDAERRKEYDQIRLMLSQNVGGRGGPGGFGFSNMNYGDMNPGQMSDLNDMLSGLFSRVRQPGSHGAPMFTEEPQQSLDLETQVTVSFYQAIEGTTVPVTFTVPGKASSELKVKVPAGVNDGQRIKVSGRGLPSGNKTGDLYVTVNVGEHPWFVRNGTTLMVKVPISYAESIVGTNVKVPTLDDPVTVKVPPMTKSGTTVKVKGRGVAIADQPKGDLLVTFDVVNPTEFSEQETRLYQQLVNEQSINPRAKYGLEK